MAAQLTQRWNPSLWDLLRHIVANGPEPEPAQPIAPLAHRMLRRLTITEVQALVDGYLSGMSVTQVARKHHVHPDTATKWLTKSGVMIRPNKIGIPSNHLPEAVTLRQAGWSWKKLGVRYGCSHTAARRAVLNHNAAVDTVGKSSR